MRKVVLVLEVMVLFVVVVMGVVLVVVLGKRIPTKTNTTYITAKHTHNHTCHH